MKQTQIIKHNLMITFKIYHNFQDKTISDSPSNLHFVNFHKIETYLPGIVLLTSRNSASITAI